MGTSLSVSIDLAMDAQGAFDALVEEISLAVKNAGLTLTFGSTGQLTDGAGTVGRVVAWEPGRRISLRWNGTEWGNPEGALVELRLDPIDGGTRVHLICENWGDAIGDGDELAGWFAGEVFAPLAQAISPARLGDWVTDRRAAPPGRVAIAGRSTAIPCTTTRTSGPSWRNSPWGPAIT